MRWTVKEQSLTKGTEKRKRKSVSCRLILMKRKRVLYLFGLPNVPFIKGLYAPPFSPPRADSPSYYRISKRSQTITTETSLVELSDALALIGAQGDFETLTLMDGAGLAFDASPAPATLDLFVLRHPLAPLCAPASCELPEPSSGALFPLLPNRVSSDRNRD